MNFEIIYDFCEDMAEALSTLIQPVMWLFSLTFGEYLDYLTNLLPLVLRPVVNGFGVIVEFMGIGDMSVLVFLFGGGIVFYFAFTFVKWILDIVL